MRFGDSSFQNLDLLAVGVAVAAIVILGVMVFLSNRKSITGKTFLLFAALTVLYGSINYLSYHLSSAWILWFLRLTIFSAVWHAFSGFQLFYVFPRESVLFPRRYVYGLVPLVILVSLITLTPFIFSDVAELSASGGAVRAVEGPLIPVFGITVVLLVFGGLFLLVKRTLRATSIEKTPFRLVSLGALITFSLIIGFNFILPVVFDNVRFIPLAPVWFLPFIACTAYAITKHHLLNIKVVATELLTFLLVAVSFAEVVLSDNLTDIIFRSGIFIGLLGFSILLIKSVLKEVEKREQLQELTKELEKKNVQLEELNKFKTGMLSLAAHQVKSPLGVIKQFATILMEGLYGPLNDKVKETVGKMKQRADDLIVLINELLDIRKLEEGKMDYQFEKVKIKDMVVEVFENLKPLAAEKKLEFSLALESEATVSVDLQKFKQVLQNLIDNSIKYTPAGFVRVAVKDETSTGGGRVVFSASDSGLGISPELLPHLFEEFVRDEKVKKKILGTGLGLSIARRIVAAHGGEIWAESEGDGKGSTFFVRLPKVDTK